MRTGYGIRHPELLNILATATPIAEEYAAWANGTLPLHVSVYDKPRQLPDELITSIRCIVIVNHQILVCHNADGFTHAWPGGRRNPGETYTETAAREIHEETGWQLDPDTIRQIGWMHLQHLTPQPDDHPHPHPDFLQIICRGEATTRDGDRAAAWTDLEGYELRSSLHDPDEARTLIAGEKLSASPLSTWPYNDFGAERRRDVPTTASDRSAAPAPSYTASQLMRGAHMSQA